MAFPTSDAKNYLDKWIANKHDGASAEDVLEMLSELARRIDEEYALVSLESEEKLLPKFEARKDDEETLDAEYDQAALDLRKGRLANWTLLLAGLQTALAYTEQDRSIALQDFRAPLIDLTRLSDVSVFGTNWGVFIRKDFWLIVVTEGNEDETEIIE